MLFTLTQTRLAALTSPDEIAFLQRTFDLSTSGGCSRRVKSETTVEKICSPPSPVESVASTEIVPSLSKTSSTGSLNGHRPKPSQSSPAISKKPSFRQLPDQQKRPNQAATRLCTPAALSRTDSGYSLTSTKKPKHVTATVNKNNGQETPHRAKNAAGTATFSSHEEKPTIGLSKSLSQIRTSSSNSSVNSSTDGNLAPVSRSLFASGRQRPPLVSSRPVSSRYAQTTSASALTSADASSTLKNPSDASTATNKKTSKIHRHKSAGDIEGTSVHATMATEKATFKVPKKQLSTAPAENILLASTWASDSTVNSKVSNASSLQLQRQGPKTPRQPVPAGLSSPASVKSVTKNPTKKVEIGKLFGLVGFNKVDTALVQNTTPNARQNQSRTNICPGPLSLDQNMKDALQREANARAALQAAEIAAESARFAASAAHADAVAAARAIVREAEIEQSRVYTGEPMIPAPTPVIAALYTPSSMTLDISSAADKELWTNAGAAIDGLSPKRKAENPFKGMF